MKKICVFNAAALIALFCFVLFSCNRSGTVAQVKETSLFTLNYGSFEDELNLFNLSSAGTINTYMTMADGFFYIANGESKKIMELNSYGDLISLLYNEQVTKNLRFSHEGSDKSVKKAVQYPFNTLGPIAVDSEKRVYVVDTLPSERHEYDSERRLVLKHVVLRFKSDGTFIDYLGQEGSGGTPFPFVKNIYVTNNNELVAVCATNEGPAVYWFNEAGFLLYMILVSDKTVPNVYGADNEENVSFVSVEKVIPDNNERTLYVKADFFVNYLDPSTKVQSGIDYDKTILFPFSIESGSYGEGFEIPSYEASVSENLTKEIYNIPFDFLGVTDEGWFFFILPIEKGYLVQMVNPLGQRIMKRVLSVNHADMLYYSLGLSANGIISALFVKREQAQVAWWRTDSLVSGLVNY